MSTESDRAYVWSVSCGQRPDLWFPATSAFNDSLSWRALLTKPEKKLLINWAANLEGIQYVRWYDWALGRDEWQMYETLRGPLPADDPRRVPDHVETRSMRRRRALLEQEPELIYRMRRQMEADLQQEAEDASSEPWYVEWERRQAERRERERADAERAEAARLEAERRQRAHMASCSYRVVCERASGAWARMRQAQAEEAAAAEADRRARDAGESSGSNQTVIEISDDDEWIDISSDDSVVYISSDESAV